MERRFLSASRFNHSCNSRGIFFINKAAITDLRYHFATIILSLRCDVKFPEIIKIRVKSVMSISTQSTTSRKPRAWKSSTSLRTPCLERVHATQDEWVVIFCVNEFLFPAIKSRSAILRRPREAISVFRSSSKSQPKRIRLITAIMSDYTDENKRSVQSRERAKVVQSSPKIALTILTFRCRKTSNGIG